MGPPEPYGPNTPEPAQNYGPDPVITKPIVLVLGPGLARGFAYAGVLHALNEAKIPVGAIVSTEMGALIGGLYVSNPTINSFDWALMKFKDEHLLKKKKFFAAVLNSDSKLEDLLSQSFGQKDMSEARIPFRVVVQKVGTQESKTLRQGSIVQAVRGALATPGNVKPIRLEDAFAEQGTVMTSGTSRPFPVAEAKQLDIGKVVVINVLKSSTPTKNVKDIDPALVTYITAAQKAGWDDLKEADLVIEPDLKGIEFFDYQKRNEIFFRGKKAIMDHEDELRNLAGIPAKGNS